MTSEQIEQRSDGRINASRQEWSQGSRRAALRRQTAENAQREIAKYPKLTPDEKLVLFASMTGGKRRQWELAGELGMTTVAFKQSKHRASQKIKEQRKAESPAENQPPGYAFEAASVVEECLQPQPSEPYNPLAGAKQSNTAHIAERVSAEAYGREDIAHIVYRSDLRRMAEGKPYIRWMPERESAPKEDVTNDAPVVTISVASLSLDGVSARLGDGTSLILPRGGYVSTIPQREVEPRLRELAKHLCR